MFIFRVIAADLSEENKLPHSPVPGSRITNTSGGVNWIVFNRIATEFSDTCATPLTAAEMHRYY